MKTTLSKIKFSLSTLVATLLSFVVSKAEDITRWAATTESDVSFQTEYWVLSSLPDSKATIAVKVIQLILIVVTFIIWIVNFIKIRKIDDKQQKKEKIKMTIITIVILLLIILLLSIAIRFLRISL